MKTLKSIITLFVIAVSIASCSTDDDSISVEDSLLVGEWNLVGSRTESITEVTAQGVTVSSTGLSIGSNFEYSVVFNQDGTLVASGSYEVTTSGTANGVAIPEQTTLVSVDETTGTWSISGSEITFTGLVSGQIDNDVFGSEIPEGFGTITALNDETLIIESDLSDATPIDAGGVDGFDIEIGGTNISTFSRAN